MFEDLIDLSKEKISYENVLIKSLQIKKENTIIVGGEEYKLFVSNLPKNSILRNGIIYFSNITEKEIPNLESILNSRSGRLEPIYEKGIRYLPMDLINEYIGLTPYAIRLYKSNTLIYTRNKNSIYFPVNMNSHVILLNNIIHYALKIGAINEEEQKKYLIYLTPENKANTYELTNEEMLITADGLYHLSLKLNIRSIRKEIRDICVQNDLYTEYRDKFIAIDTNTPLIVYSQLPVVKKPIVNEKMNIKGFLDTKFVRTKIDNKNSKNLFSNIKFIYIVYMKWEYLNKGGDTEVLPYSNFVKEVTSYLKTEIVELNTDEDICKYHLKNFELIKSSKSFIVDSVDVFTKLRRELNNKKLNDNNILDKHCTLSIVILDKNIKKAITINGIESFSYKRGVLTINKKNESYTYDSVLRIEMI